MIIKKHLSKQEIEEIVKKIENLGYRRVKEKHEALLHRFDSSDGIIKIYKKLKKEDDYSIIITGSSDFEKRIYGYLFEGKKLDKTDREFELVIGVDESGVSSYDNFIVSGVSYRIFDLVDSKKIPQNRLRSYFSDVFINSEFLGVFKFHIGIVEYIRKKGYTIGDIVNAVSKALVQLFENIGISVKVRVDGDKPAKVESDPNIEYLGKGGELKDRNVAAAGVISTYLRRATNLNPRSQPP